ncbi:MAG: cupin domain-containing protein [Phycisphaerae bacterium]|nr:cupin domain-containing protein [Phycisphaerae bacterium]
MIESKNVAQVEPMPNPHGVAARKLHDSEHAQVVHLTMTPGQGLRPHITPVDVCFYVLAGRGTVEIGAASREVGPETLVESPAGIRHRWQNDGDETLSILVIKAPKPTQQTQLL